MVWMVTRQCYYYSGENVVEVSYGGRDYCGSDALSAKYDGEFEAFDDLREAVEVAIEICRQWRKDGQKDARIGVGCTMGMGLEIEGNTFENARKIAKHAYEKAPKCPMCGGIMPDDEDEWWRFYDEGWESDERYCSERCAERAYEQDMEYQQEMEEKGMVTC